MSNSNLILYSTCDHLGNMSIIFYSQLKGELSHRGLLDKCHNSPDHYTIIFYSQHMGEFLKEDYLLKEQHSPAHYIVNYLHLIKVYLKLKAVSYNIAYTCRLCDRFQLWLSIRLNSTQTLQLSPSFHHTSRAYQLLLQGFPKQRFLVGQ